MEKANLSSEKKKQNREYERLNVKKKLFVPSLELEELLVELDKVQDKSLIISKIINIYQDFLLKEREKYKILYAKKRDVFDLCEYCFDEDSERQIKDCYLRELGECSGRIKYLTSKCRQYSKMLDKKTKEIKVLFEDEIVIDSVQENIKKSILNKEEICDFEFSDILYAFGNLIKYDAIAASLITYANDIVKQITCQKINDDAIISGIYYTWDSLKYRLLHTSKDEKETRKILKDIRILFDFAIKSYKEDDCVQKHDYLFNIVDYFLEEEDYFLYLKKIVEEIPKIVNVRYINKSNNTSEHIVIYIIDKFIDNYRKMLQDKNGDYINKDYLRKVYFLFTQSYSLSMKKEERKVIDTKLASFMREVNIFLTSSKRKNAVKEDLKDMYTDKFYIDKKEYLLPVVNEDKLERQMNSIFLRLRDASKYQENILDYTVTFKDGSHAYSLQKQGDKYVLKIHVVDLYTFVISYSDIDKYIFNQTLLNRNVDPFILNQITMRENETYPTITYEISFDSNGNYLDKDKKMKGMKIYKSKVKIDKKYTDYDLMYFVDEELDLYRKLYKNVSTRCGNYNENYLLSDIEDIFEDVLNYGVVQYFEDNDLPFIYSGTCYKDEKEFVSIMNNIGHTLSRLEQDDFNKIYNVLNSDIDFFHYSVEPFNGDYKLAILDPLSYPGVLIQRILHEVVIDCKYSDSEYRNCLEQIRKVFEDTVMYLNYYNDYVDKEVLKNNKGRLVKVKKSFFNS